MQGWATKKRVLCFIFVLLMMLGCLTGCRKEDSAAKVYTNMADLEKARIGLVTGCMPNAIIPKMLPDAKYQEFNSVSDAAMALESGLVDAYPTDESIYLCMQWEDIKVNRIVEPIASSTYGVIFGKGENLELQKQFNTFLADFIASGERERLEEKWFASSEPTEFLSYDGLKDINGTLRVGITTAQRPFVYLKNGKYAGFDIEMLILFAQEYGYKLAFEDAQFGSVLTGVSLGVYDMGAAGFTITEDRAESLDFSDVYHTEDIVFVVRGNSEQKKTLDDYSHAKVGAATGTYGAVVFSEAYPEAEVVEYNTMADMALALEQEKVEGCIFGKAYYTCMKWEGMNVERIDEPLKLLDTGMVFKKGDNGQLRQQINEFIAEIKENGVYNQLQEKWFGETEPTEFLDYTALTGTNGTLEVITTAEAKPYVYLKDQRLVGYDIDVLTLFAEKHGYQLELTDVTFSAILLGVAQGNYDLGVGGFTITEERAESVDFSDPYNNDEMLLIVRPEGSDTSPQTLKGFLDSLWVSFEKTFIRENRWKLIVEGIVTTIVISTMAVLGGSALGFALYMAARSQYKAVSAVTKLVVRIYSKLIAGTPTLVVLMLLFYVVFGKADLSGIIVAIIGFTITFSAFVYGQLALTVESVDKGQTEAAYALGYNRNRTFFRIILPQAMRMFVPVYSAEIIGLIKATAVVGYITVGDLTKMGDIIRSNTYEAFFPLIAVAAIYFLLTCGVAALLDILRKKTEPKRRKNDKLLKGVVR